MITDDRYAELSAGFDEANARFNQAEEEDMTFEDDVKTMSKELLFELRRDYRDAIRMDSDNEHYKAKLDTVRKEIKVRILTDTSKGYSNVSELQ